MSNFYNFSNFVLKWFRSVIRNYMNTTFFRAVYLRYNEYNYALKPSFCITASNKTFKIHGVFFNIRAYKGINIGNLLYFVLCNNFPDLYRRRISISRNVSLHIFIVFIFFTNEMVSVLLKCLFNWKNVLTEIVRMTLITVIE